MLKSLVPKLACPTCKNTTAVLTLHIFNDGEDGHVRDGLLVCQSCSAWYPIEDELLEFVPMPLLDRTTLATFPARFASGLAAANCMAPPPEEAVAKDSREQKFTEQMKQREHFDHYAEGIQPGFDDYTKSRFILAATRRYVDLWACKLESRGGWLLDIGCDTRWGVAVLADRTQRGF